jgi:hypothetical protein
MPVKAQLSSTDSTCLLSVNFEVNNGDNLAQANSTEPNPKVGYCTAHCTVTWKYMKGGIPETCCWCQTKCLPFKPAHRASVRTSNKVVFWLSHKVLNYYNFTNYKRAKEEKDALNSNKKVFWNCKHIKNKSLF